MDHEVVFKRLLVVNTFLALIPITVDLLYEYGKALVIWLNQHQSYRILKNLNQSRARFPDNVTHFEAYLSGKFNKEISANLALEAVIFLVFASLLEFLSR